MNDVLVKHIRVRQKRVRNSDSDSDQEVVSPVVKTVRRQRLRKRLNIGDSGSTGNRLNERQQLKTEEMEAEWLRMKKIAVDDRAELKKLVKEAKEAKN